MVSFKRPQVKETDSLSIPEFADALGFSVPALVEALNRNLQAIKKPFYSIPELATRWNCSRATVYNVLRESELKILNVGRKGTSKGKWAVPASVVEHIERSRTQHIPESAAA